MKTVTFTEYSVLRRIDRHLYLKINILSYNFQGSRFREEKSKLFRILYNMQFGKICKPY